MRSIKHKIDICAAVAHVTIKEYLVYRSHMMVSLFVGPVYFVVQFFIWTAVYGDGGALVGFEYEQMIRYFGITALLGYVTWNSADWNLSMLIRTGRYLTFALRPLNHRFFALSQKIGHRLLAIGFELIPCTFIFILLFGIDMRPSNIGWFVLSVALAFFMNFYVNYCLGLASFWIVQTDGIRYLYALLSTIFAGALVPLVFFPVSLQFIQFFLPFQYISYVPVMVFLGEYRLGGFTLSIPAIVGIQGAAVIVMFILSEILYKSAMKRFTAVGA